MGIENKNTSCDCNSIHNDKMKEGKKGLKKIKDFGQLSSFFKTFADETRLKIMVVLDSVDEMCVCDIAVALNMTKSAISHQLSYLKDNGLIKSRKIGKIVFYSIMDDHVKSVLEMGIEHTKHGGKGR